LSVFIAHTQTNYQLLKILPRETTNRQDKG